MAHTIGGERVERRRAPGESFQPGGYDHGARVESGAVLETNLEEAVGPGEALHEPVVDLDGNALAEPLAVRDEVLQRNRARQLPTLCGAIAVDRELPHRVGDV